MWSTIVNFFNSINWSHPATISFLIIVGSALSFVFIWERIFPYQKGLPIFRKGFYLDFVWYTIIQSFIMGFLIFSLIIGPIKDALPFLKDGLISHWPVWLLILIFFVTHDFYIYWFHRWQHYNKYLWRTHEAHHSVEQVDFAAGSRSHMVEILINQTIEFAPIILLLDAPTGLLVQSIKVTIDAVYGQFIHSNVNAKLGWFGYIFNGPRLHQWHHGDQVEVYHANFATKLSLWDYLFKTAYNPDLKPIKYGVWYRFPRDWFAQHIFSVYRFNVEKVENSIPLKWYFNFRVNAIKLFFKTWKTIFGKRITKRRLIDGEIYAPKPELAEIDY
jgi:sterol desaturase/sphingolipid hydroxylase (fatty acid hydroxylase superfamily)